MSIERFSFGRRSDLRPEPPLRWRIIFSVAAGVACAMVAGAFEVTNPGLAAAFDQLWAAGAAVRDGADPYAHVGPGRAFEWPWPLYYPLTAVIAALPLTVLPVTAARAVAVAVGGALFFFALSRGGHARLLVVFSLPFIQAVYLAHSSLLTTAAAVLPGLGIVAALKPNIGLVITAADPSVQRLRSVALGGSALLAISLAVRPEWIGTWLELTSTAPHFTSPVLRPGGFLLLLAVLRWRRWDARLLLAISLVPHTPDGYEMLLLFLIPRQLLEVATLVVLSWVAWVLAWPAPDFDALTTAFGNLAIWLLFLPCLLMVMARPNEPSGGAAPHDGDAAELDPVELRPQSKAQM